MFCFCFYLSEVIFSFKSLIAGSQVLALLMLFLCVIVHTMWSGRSMHLVCILPFGMLCMSCHQYDVCEHYVSSVYVGRRSGLNESGLSVSSVNCVQSVFL